MAARHAWLAPSHSHSEVHAGLQPRRKNCPGPGRCVFSCFGETAALVLHAFSFLSSLALLGSGKGNGNGTVRLRLRLR